MKPFQFAMLALLLTACGGDSPTTASSSQTLAVGRYAYEAYGGDFSGTLTLTFATPDSVGGSWDVRNRQGERVFVPAVELGFYNVSAYVLAARGERATALTYSHRIARDGSAFTCTALIMFGPSFPCRVSYLGR